MTAVDCLRDAVSVVGAAGDGLAHIVLAHCSSCRQVLLAKRHSCVFVCLFRCVFLVLP